MLLRRQKNHLSVIQLQILRKKYINEISYNIYLDIKN